MIDAIADERVGETAEIEQAVPIGIVAREAGHFESEHDADMSKRVRHRVVVLVDLDVIRSVVHGQHSGDGGVPVHFWGDRHHRGSEQRGRYGLGAHPGPVGPSCIKK